MDQGFGIYFLDGPAEHNSVPALIRMGDFQERLLVNVSRWSREDYKRTWAQAVDLLREKDKSALITSYGGPPPESSGMRCWPLYRSQDVVYVHEQLLFFEQLDTHFSEAHWWRSIPDRRVENEDGQKISEWCTRWEDLLAFRKSLG
ncbi:MAG: hypothetical protein KDB82_06220 [Planctomycetes bacterium]|nr:hypothetical protein [Planctomycetota bacterium]